jgi:hypothetical protein
VQVIRPGGRTAEDTFPPPDNVQAPERTSEHRTHSHNGCCMFSWSCVSGARPQEEEQPGKLAWVPDSLLGNLTSQLQKS